MTIRLDHIVLLVDDLESGRAEFEQRGFRVSPGGTHAGGLTSNELIGLADGTYLELLAFNVPPDTIDLTTANNPLADRFVPRVHGRSGLIDAAVAVDNLDAVAALNGFPVQGPFHGKRTRPDGVLVEWKMAFPEYAGLPFVLQDVTERALRVPGGEAAQHPNGVTGVASITLGDPKPGVLYDWLVEVTGVPRQDTPRIGGCEVRIESAETPRVLEVMLRSAGGVELLVASS